MLKVPKTASFVRELRVSAHSYETDHHHVDPVRLMRCASSSPSTPTASSSFMPNTCKSRKQLKLDTPTSIQETYEDKDYGAEIDEPVDSVMSQLEALFANCGKTDLKQIRTQTASLCSRKEDLSSVLYRYRETTLLRDNAGNIIKDIVIEMIQRVPSLLQAMMCAAVPKSDKLKESILPVLAAAYSILMKNKYDNLSAFQRMTTAIAIKGGLDERVTKCSWCSHEYYVLQAQTRLNHLGLLLSWACRVNLQDSVESMSHQLIVESLKSNPLIKVTGDNLDVFVKTSNLNKERPHKDLHLFSSNIIFSRIAKVDMCKETPSVDIAKLDCEDILMKNTDKAKFLEYYSVLLGRILCTIPAFLKYRSLMPEHIPHEYSQKMSDKSTVHPLPIMMKNECKHEDCLAILDSYEEQLINLYTHAYGNADILRKYGGLLGGDQLTRVRLQEAKNIRSLSVTPEKRFDNLHPIFCEMWHTKQDLLGN